MASSEFRLDESRPAPPPSGFTDSGLPDTVNHQLKGYRLEQEGLQDVRRRLHKAGVVDDFERAIPDRVRRLYPALDMGFLMSRPVCAFRWAPIPITTESDFVISKGVRVLIEPGGILKIDNVAISPGSSDLDLGSWTGFSLRSKEYSEMPLWKKLELAIRNTSGRIKDERQFVNGQLVGRPGIGRD